MRGCHQKAGNGLHTNTSETYGNGSQSGELVAALLKEITCRDTHTSVSNKVCEYAKCTHPVSYVKLILKDITHGRCEIGYERDHSEEQNHHDDSQYITLFVYSCFYFVRLLFSYLGWCVELFIALGNEGAEVDKGLAVGCVLIL